MEPAASTARIRSVRAPVEDPSLRTTDDATVETAAVLTGASRDAEFDAFMILALPTLSRIAILLAGNTHLAEDLVQNTLMRTYIAWPRARARDPLAYARKTLANLRIDTWRKMRRELPTDPALIPERPIDGHESAQADRDELLRALRALRPKMRRIVVLRYLEGMPEKEVAETLDVPLGTVKSTASRGLSLLRSSMTSREGHVR